MFLIKIGLSFTSLLPCQTSLSPASTTLDWISIAWMTARWRSTRADYLLTTRGGGRKLNRLEDDSLKYRNLYYNIWKHLVIKAMSYDVHFFHIYNYSMFLLWEKILKFLFSFAAEEMWYITLRNVSIVIFDHY